MISVLVPTRNRPDNVRRLVTSGRATADGDLEFIFYVDDDDEVSADVVRELDCELLTGPRVVLSEMWNRCWERASHDVAMHCGDDIIFRSEHWDTRVLEAFDLVDDKIAFVHGRDGFQDAQLGTHGFLHRRWVEAVGYFVPPYFSSDYNDLWLTEVADALDRRVYLPDIYTEHMHPVVGKAELDQTHQDRLERHQRDGVDRIYRRSGAQRAADVAKLRVVIEQFQDSRGKDARD